MRSLLVGTALAGASLSLYGCGGGTETTPSPTPSPTPGGRYDGSTVQKVWDNHLDAFVNFNVPKIMLDYDDNSVMRVWNDKCFKPDNGATREGMKEHKGKAAIEAFFTALFAQLKTIDNVNFIGPVGMKDDDTDGKPSVKEIAAGGNVADGNVFLTWRTSGLTGKNQIDLATDTFSFRKEGDNYMIDLQTIVTTEPEADCASGGAAIVPVEGEMKDAWDNHFAAFGAANVSMIMEDYDENSIVQVYDNRNTVARTAAYSEFAGLTKIQDMFTQLFADIAAAKVGEDNGVKVGLLEVDQATNSVFLGWRSFSHPKATDTFIFNGNKIARQTIVVSTKEPSRVEAIV